MPSVPIKLVPGVNSVKTPALNEAGIAASNMIRFREGLVEKRGGWTQYFGGTLSFAGRNILAWRDRNQVLRIAIGGDNYLKILSGTSLVDVTPQTYYTSTGNQMSTTSGSSTVTITDPNYSPRAGDIVGPVTFYALGGIILYQQYTVVSVLSSTQYTVTASRNATSTASGVPSSPVYTTTAGSPLVNVQLVAHGFSVAQNYQVNTVCTFGGVTLSGNYNIVSVVNANNFTISAGQVATSTATQIEVTPLTLQYIINPTIFSPRAGTNYGSSWSIANFGTLLIASFNGGGVYTWDSTQQYANIQPISTAPSGVAGIIVCDAQQMIVAYGAPLGGNNYSNGIYWCDAGNPGVWTASSTNLAGSFPIPTGSGVIGMVVADNSMNLLWTDIDVWMMNYIGYPGVWGFNKLATGCGLISQFAHIRLGTSILWMSQKQFWIFRGGEVSPLDCPVWDSVFPVLNRAYVRNIRGGANSGFNEALWFFPSVSSASGENDTYVCYNVAENTWDIGTGMPRSGWIDQSTAGFPLAADSLGNLFQHETSPDAAGSALNASFTTGFFMLSEGEMFSFIDWIRPDIRFPNGTGTVQLSVLTRDYVSDTPTTNGPYSITAATEFINTRCRGRYIAFVFSSADIGSFWRIGRVQMRFAPSGRR